MVKTVDVKKCCSTCRKAIALKSAVVGVWVGECRAHCPAVMAVPSVTVMGEKRLNVQPIFPPVNGSMWCHDYEPEE